MGGFLLARLPLCAHHPPNSDQAVQLGEYLITDAIESATSGIAGAVLMSQLYCHSILTLGGTKVLSDSLDITAPGNASKLLINGSAGGYGAQTQTLAVAVDGVTIGTKSLSDLWLEYSGNIASGATVTVTLTITETSSGDNSVYYNGVVFFVA